MMSAVIVAIALTASAASNPQPVRVWRADSIVYVQTRENGHLVLLHVAASGRIRVLFPLSPDADTVVAAGTPVAIVLPPEAQGNPATFVAVQSRWPFEFSALRVGSSWDYGNAWLLQPTGGDPLAAALDIADRITDGRPYDYRVAAYSRTGTAVARGPVVAPDVCLSCVRRGPATSTIAATASNAVDCSSASLTNSFCGVNSGSVSITTAPPPQIVYQTAPAPAAAPVYVPYFVPMSHGFRSRFEPSPRPVPAPARSQGVAYPIAPRLIVPSFAHRRP